MKKLRIGVLVLLASLFLTGCGCEKKEEFTVTFDSNGGSQVESQIVNEGDMAIKPVDPTKDGYDFDGWYLDLEDEEYDFSTEVTEDITLEAKWSQITSGDDEPEEEKPTEKPEEDKKEEKLCKLTCNAGYELVNGNSKDCKCEKVKVSSVSLNKTNITLVVGKSETVTATVNPWNAFDKSVTWKSSNTAVATVQNGKITAVSEGSATITVVASGKTASVKVTVVSQDQTNLNAALNAITAKPLSNGNTSINYSANGCTITNTANQANDSRTVISNGVVTTLYRGLSNGTISSTYTVTCGKLSNTKTVNHTVPASTYSYTSSYNGMLHIISVTNATNYTLSSAVASNLKYLAAANGVQTPIHTPGTEYQMVLDSNPTTIFAVKSAE